MIKKITSFFKQVRGDNPKRKRGNAYLFLPINGAGLGHLTRSLAIAKHIRKLNPSAEIIFLTTSIAIHIVHQAGFICHHVPPFSLTGEEVSGRKWNNLFYKSIENVLDLYGVGTIVFDGSRPYFGLKEAMSNNCHVRFVWVKRGLLKVDVNTQEIASCMKLFDLVIIPSEVLDEDVNKKEQSANVRKVEPIYLLSRDELLTADRAKKALRLDKDRRSVYVQLGAGNINQIVNLQEQIVDILKTKGFQVVVGNSPISLSSEPCLKADSVIINYPNSQYYEAFDFAVLAAGYNTVCESVALGLPAVFIPNMATGADNQLERAMRAEMAGPYGVLTEFNENVFKNAIQELVRKIESMKLKADAQTNGATEAAKILLGIR